MSDDIVAQLRAPKILTQYGPCTPALHLLAAEEIERLRAELAALKAEFDEAKQEAQWARMGEDL